MRNSRVCGTVAFCLLALLTAACDTTNPGNNISSVPPERLVALTAVYAETDEGGAPIQRIVVLDYNDPSNYEVLSRGDHVSIQPRFSPDKCQLLFGDRSIGAPSAPRLVRYDLHAGKADTLVYGQLPDGSGLPLLAPTHTIVWQSDGAGFYFTNPIPPFSIKQDVFSYRFADEHVERIHDAGEFSVLPWGLKGPDTLIVFSNAEPITAQPPGFFYMDLWGNYLGHLDNPHLGLLNENGVNTKAAYHVTWNDQSKRFAFAMSDSTVQGYRIAVTDLDGSYYRAYTTGKFIDDHPRWGPGSESILFDRREVNDHSFTGYRTMVVNVESGAVREFVEPDVIDGAVGLRFPDY